MAKRDNLLIRSKDGKLTLATGSGVVVAVDRKILKMKILDLIAKRQEAGHQLTDVLAEAGFEVKARQVTHVWDPGDPKPKKTPKK